MTAFGWRNGSSAATAIGISLLWFVAARAEPPRIEVVARPVRLPAVAPGTDEPGASSAAIASEHFFASQGIQGISKEPHAGIILDEGVAPQVTIDSGGLVLPPSQAIDAATRSPRANAGVRDQGWVGQYHARIAPHQPERWWKPTHIEETVALSTPWWDAQIRQPIGMSDNGLPVDIAALTAGALHHSSFVKVVSANPMIRQSELVREQAAFDWTAFLETTYNDINDPVGSTLTTGTDADRYRNQNWGVNGGVGRRNEYGGEVELFQRFGGEEDNSRFLDPNPQRATRLELQYTQPLMRGAGRAYNQSLIVLAQIQLDQSSDGVATELQEHLVKVTEAYWELYRARAEFYQRQKLLASSESILANLQHRREVDAVERQVFRARTAVLNRESEILRVETRIRNWQSQLRLLVNDPGLVQAGNREFLPSDSPLYWEIPLSMSDSLHTALINRPDISNAIRDAHAASVRLGAAQKDILPKLDFVASTYVAGLAAGSDRGRAFGNQFSAGRPAFSVGFQYEMPFGNRALRAQAKRRQTELEQAMSRFSLTVEEALTSVEVAVREVETSYREMVAKHRAMRAAQSEADYLDDRWRVLPDVHDSAAQLLENLLDAQERVADEEQAVVNAQINYAISIIKLKSEMGTLLRVGR